MISFLFSPMKIKICEAIQMEQIYGSLCLISFTSLMKTKMWEIMQIIQLKWIKTMTKVKHNLLKTRRLADCTPTGQLFLYNFLGSIEGFKQNLIY